jgi:uncharacterized membrane protein required for colicin V production
MTLDSLPFNWFDLLVVIALVVGVRCGRKHGMSEELMKLLKWVALMVGCAFCYEPIGNAISSGSSVFDLLSGYLIAYLGTALAIAALFALLKKAVGEKMVSSEVFGRTEFYLGMMAGMVRFSCIMIMGLALLNARSLNQAEIRADINYQNDVYGSNYFPKLYSVQSQVFEHSLAGPWIKDNLSFLLIKSTSPDQKELKRKQVEL